MKKHVSMLVSAVALESLLKPCLARRPASIPEPSLIAAASQSRQNWCSISKAATSKGVWANFSKFFTKYWKCTATSFTLWSDKQWVHGNSQSFEMVARHFKGRPVFDLRLRSETFCAARKRAGPWPMTYSSCGITKSTCAALGKESTEEFVKSLDQKPNSWICWITQWTHYSIKTYWKLISNRGQ